MSLKIHCATWLIGLISGLSVVLTGSTLNFWLAKNSISTAEVGLFSLVALPYCINFIWSPILDRLKVPIITNIFGQRLAWTLFLQIMLGAMVLLLSWRNPLLELAQIALLAFIIALLSSTNDNVLNALRSEILPINKQGSASGSYVFGYRIGMMLCNSGAIYLSIFLPWQQIYQIVAACFVIFPFILIALLKRSNQGKEPESKSKVGFSTIFTSIGSRKFIASILVFLILYRIADNFINTMINPFLLDLNFSVAQIATTGKLCASIGTIIGGIFGGYLMQRLNIIQSLLYFGAIHTSAHLLLAMQAIIGNNLALYFVTSISESLTGGMAMAAYIAFITSICKGRYKATQQGFFSSMMGVSRSVFPSISGFIASHFGWLNFFLIAFALSVPALVILYYMKKDLEEYLYPKDQKNIL